MADAINITAPVGAETFKMNEVTSVTWTGATGHEVNLYLTKGGVTVDTEHNISDPSPYSYTFPTGLTPGADFRIMLEDDNTLKTDQSGLFTINGTLTVRALAETLTGAITGPDVVINLEVLAETLTAAGSLVYTYNWVRALSEVLNVKSSVIFRIFRDSYDHYVYHIDKDRWTKFSYVDLIKAVVLSGGNTLENINLLLDSVNEINKYPGANYTAIDAQIKTKKFYMGAGVLKRVKTEYEGSPQIFTRVWNRDYGSPYYAEDELTSIETEKFQTVENGKNRGSAFEVIIKNATRILKIITDVKLIGRFKGD